jgi:hypothetical protein
MERPHRKVIERWKKERRQRGLSFPASEFGFYASPLGRETADSGQETPDARL